MVKYNEEYGKYVCDRTHVILILTFRLYLKLAVLGREVGYTSKLSAYKPDYTVALKPNTIPIFKTLCSNNQVLLSQTNSYTNNYTLHYIV